VVRTLECMTNTPKKTKRRGQGMTEYIIIVALIAIAAIGVITLFGDNIRRLFGMAADGIAGDDNITQRNTSGAGNDQNLTKKTMKSFATNNTSQY
jgi:pilus assembly protein Flp/PilA